MIEEAYAAGTSRKIAANAGLPNAIHSFETMDELFIELFRARRTSEPGAGGSSSIAQLFWVRVVAWEMRSQ
jgi:hypothetical protein